MKIFMCCMVFVLGAVFCRAEGAGDDLQTLKEERAKLALEMHKKRVEMIKNDKALRELQKKIIALYKELAIRIDNNPEMRKLIEKSEALDRDIRALENGDE